MSNEFNKMYAPPSYLDSKGNKILNEDQDRLIVEYINSNNDKAKSFLRSNRGWKSAESCMAVFYGDDTEKIPLGLSKIKVRKLRRQAREAIANATNIRPRWEHRSFGDKFPQESKTYDELRDDWWYTQAVDKKLEGALQFAGGGTTGYLYLWPDYDPATNELEITVTPLNWKQVLPYHAGVNATIDNLYGVTVWQEMPVPEAHAKYPKHIGVIKADRNVPGFFARGWQVVNRKWRGVYDRIKNRQTAFAEDPYPAVDIFTSWIRDLSINDTGKTILMGEAGARYSYNVPSKYDINGNINQIDDDGNIISGDNSNYGKYRIITDKECKLFPYQRYTITTNTGVIYDGPPLYLNRFRPIIPFKFEDVVGEFLGINLIRDGRSLEDSSNNMLRAIEDATIGRIQPPMGISKKIPVQIRALFRRNPRLMSGKVFEVDNPDLLAKSIVPLIPANYYEIDPRTVEIIKYNQDMQDYQMGTNDASFMTKLNQMPAADTQEAYLRSLGAISTRHARGIELAIIQMARVWLDFAPQVYTLSRIITKFSSIDLMASAADFDPKSLIPDPKLYPNCSFAERWQKHIRNFHIFATPYSLQEEMSQTNKLTLMTMQKIGVPISNKTIYNSFRPDGKFDLEKEEWIKEQEEKILLSAKLQRELAKANQEADPQNQMASKLADMVNSQNNEGRPNSFAKSPTLEAKTNPDGTQRTTVATS